MSNLRTIPAFRYPCFVSRLPQRFMSVSPRLITCYNFVTFGSQFLSILSTAFDYCQRSQLAIFREGTFDPFLMFQWVFSPPLHQLRGCHSVFRAANPSQVTREYSKSYFECCIWILTVKYYNAYSFSQNYNFQNQKIAMFENIGYIYKTELTVWHCYQGHTSGTCV